MNLFYDKFDNHKIEYRENFDSYDKAIITVFQVLTNSAWQHVLYLAFNSDVHKFISATYLISWILIGNYIFLNLFLAIMLDEFFKESQNSGKITEEDKEEMLFKEKIECLEKPAITMQNFNNSFYNPGEIVEHSAFTRPGSGFDDEPRKNINKMTSLCQKIISNNRWELFMQIIIICSCLSIVLETYVTSDLSFIILISFDHVLNTIFLIEFMIKIIAHGIVEEKESYMRNQWNVMDFFILILSFVDSISRSIVGSNDWVQNLNYYDLSFFIFYLGF